MKKYREIMVGVLILLVLQGFIVGEIVKKMKNENQKMIQIKKETGICLFFITALTVNK